MADVFNLVATLSLNTADFLKGLAGAEAQANSFGGKLGKGVGTAARVGAAAVAAAGAAVTAFGVASVKTGMSFDQSMSQVAATMGVTVDDIQDLRDFAQEMGATTAFSATQAADALNYMALAGYDAETSMATLPNVLNLAAAGGMELARASDMITDSQSALGLTMDETGALVDQMAKTASKSNTSVSQLGDAILTIGGTAQFMAGGTDRLNTVLGILADNGIKGSEAGTHLRNMLLKLSDPTDEGATAIEKLGLNIYDSEGHMRDMQDIIQDLGTAMSDMTDEQKVNTISALFNTRDVAAVQALLGTTTERWNELGEAIVDSEGAAQAMADTQLDNLSGDITLLKSAFEGVQIAVSDMLTPAIRDFIQMATEGLSGLAEALQNGDFEGAVTVIADFLSNALDMAIEALPAVLDFGLTIINTLVTGLIDNLPQIITMGIELIIKLAQGLIAAIPQLIAKIPEIVSAIMAMFGGSAPQFISQGISLIGKLASGFGSALPMVITAIGNIIINLLSRLYQSYPTIMQRGFELISKLASGILNNLPAIITAITSVITRLIGTIVTNLPRILQTGITLLGKLAAGIIQAIPKVIAAIPQVITGIVNGFKTYNWAQIGTDLLNGVKNGILNAVGNVVSAARSAASSIFNAVKGFFHIGSPSKLMRDQIGKQIGIGMALGISDTEDDVSRAMDKLSNAAMGGIEYPEISVTGAYGTKAKSSNALLSDILRVLRSIDGGMGESMADAVQSMRLSVDNREFGRMVRDVSGAY